MGEITDPDYSILVEAVLVWTGWGQSDMPKRDDSLLANHFGNEVACRLLPSIKALVDDFYSSDARFVADDLEEMEKISTEQFKRKHPEVADKVVKALAWCYTFDFK